MSIMCSFCVHKVNLIEKYLPIIIFLVSTRLTINKLSKYVKIHCLGTVMTTNLYRTLFNLIRFMIKLLDSIIERRVSWVSKNTFIII